MKQLKIAVLLAYLSLYCLGMDRHLAVSRTANSNGPDGWGWAARVTIILGVLGTAIICIWSFVGI